MATILGFPVVEHPPCDNPACAVCRARGVVVFGPLRWRRPSDNAAEQLARRSILVPEDGFTANVIEGDHH